MGRRGRPPKNMTSVKFLNISNGIEMKRVRLE